MVGDNSQRSSKNGKSRVSDLLSWRVKLRAAWVLLMERALEEGTGEEVY